MLNRKIIFSLNNVLTALFLFFAITPVHADKVGTFTFLDGRVEIIKDGQERAVPVEVGAPVSVKDIIRTKTKSRAEVTFRDASVVRLAHNTRMEITDFLFNENDETQARTFTLTRGKIRTILPDGLSDLEIITPNARADASGTDFYFIYEKGSSWFYGSGGTLLASNNEHPGEEVFVKWRSCFRAVPRSKYMDDSCTFNEIDEKKHGWDTAARELVPVVAQLPTEGEVYTYTPLGGRALDTPSQPVPIAFDDLVCSQCPPLAIPLIEEAPVPLLVPAAPEQTVIKMGDFRRLDRSQSIPIQP